MKDTGKYAVNELLAGKTVFSVNHGNRPVYRPEGMTKWVLHYTVSGAGRISRGAESFIENPGDAVLFPPGVPHDYITDKSAEDWVHLWVYFGINTRLTGLLNWPEINGGVLGFHIKNTANRVEIEKLLSQTVEIWGKNIPRKINFCYNLLERALLICDMENPLSETVMDRRIGKAIDYMNERTAQKIKLDDIAVNCGLSVSRFVHLFSKTTGLPPVKYLEKIRIEKAQGLLIGSNMKLAEIAEATGYGNEYYFSKVFKKLTGRAPGKFRKCLNI